MASPGICRAGGQDGGSVRVSLQQGVIARAAAPSGGVLPLGAGDICSDPVILSGEGSFGFNNQGATTGSNGQMECGPPPGIDNDLWLEWTARESGLLVVDACNSTTNLALKLAAYPGGGCPQDGTSLACNDDGACGGDGAYIFFRVKAGASYLIQIGNTPGSSPGSGILSIELLTDDCYAYDDGSSEGAFGLSGGGGLMWLAGHEASGGSDVLTAASVVFGTGQGLSANQPGFVVVYDDPSNDFDPTDANLLYSSPIVTSKEDTGQRVAFDLPRVPVNGVFFVGFLVNNLDLEFPVSRDTSQPSGGRAWLVGNANSDGGLSAFNLQDLAQNGLPPLNPDSVSGGSVFLLRADGLGCGLGSNYCSGAPNSISPLGSTMVADGSPSLGDMNLNLRADNAPSQPAIFFFGPNQVDLPLSDGRLCVGGGIVRMPVVMGQSGYFEYQIDFATYGAALTALPSTNFQCWYRDPAAGGSGSNLSDAVEVVLTP